MKNILFALFLFVISYKSFSQTNSNIVQVAILLDVSSSMDGLIAQAKNELWGVVNSISKLQKNGESPKIEIAFYDYGKTTHPVKNGYIRKLFNFTSDLDTISEVLFSLNTNGGDEYCGQVIQLATSELLWNNQEGVYKVIFIAGNENFNQGSVNYKLACENAAKNNINLNTIHCGNELTGINENWKNGATYGKGSYFWIDANKQETFIPSPYDSILQVLNDSLNTTFWQYRSSPIMKDYKSLQLSVDKLNKDNKKANLERIKAKSSKKGYAQSTHKWDINGKFEADSTIINILADSMLPVVLQGKNIKEKKTLIRTNLGIRDTLTTWIQYYSKLRDAYVTEFRRNAINTTPNELSLGTAIEKAIKEQASKHGFIFKEM